MIRPVVMKDTAAHPASANKMSFSAGLTKPRRRRAVCIAKD
jgi:hypothetical protein